MQPNNQNGYWQPQEDQPVQPSSPPPPQPPVVQQGISPQPTQPQPVYDVPPPLAQPTVTQQPQPVQVQQTVQSPQQSDYVPTPLQLDSVQPASYPAQPIQQYSSAEPTEQLDGQEQYADDDEYYDEQDDESNEFDDEADAVNWQATEYIHQEKGVQWFVIFGVVFAAMLAVAIFLMKAPTFAILLVVVAATIIVFAKRPPRVISYSLSSKGLHIGDTLHNFASFKSFGVIHDGAEYSVMLIPTKRFQPGVSVYFPEESGEAIVDMLGARLPMQDLKLDPVDKLTRFLRL